MTLPSTKSLIGVLFNVALTLSVATSLAFAADAEPPQPPLLTNVNVFDGNSKKLPNNANVLVENNLIRQVSQEPIEAAGATVIDGGRRTLTPGFIDAHTHILVNDVFERLIYDHTQIYDGALGTVNAKAMLRRGLTTVRDVGGPVQGLKAVIDQGLTEEPRILPSEASITQSSGHGDFDPRMTYLSSHFTGQINKTDIFGWSKIADGVPEVMKATRENLRAGATQIKIMGSGDLVIVDGDPLEDISLLGDPEKNLKLIMKDGKI